MPGEKPSMWYCCHCLDGPMTVDTNLACVGCFRWRCVDCSLEKWSCARPLRLTSSLGSIGDNNAGGRVHSSPLPRETSDSVSTGDSSPASSSDTLTATPATAESNTNSGQDDSVEEECHEIGEIIFSVLSAMGQSAAVSRLLDTLFSKYHQWRQHPAGRRSNRPSRSSGRGGGPSRGGRRPAANGRPASGIGQRRASESGDQAGDDLDDEPMPDTERDISRDTTLQLFFACPYWKRDCNVWKTCFAYKLRGVKYVKDHLKRIHAKVCYYDRCGKEFETRDDLRVHTGSQPQCSIERFQTWWLSEGQKETLSERSNAKHTPEQQWYAVWDVVFPSQPRPDSPYIDQSLSEDLSSFLEFSLTEGPDIIRQFGGEEVGTSPLRLGRQLLQMGLRRIYFQWASAREGAPLVTENERNESENVHVVSALGRSPPPHEVPVDEMDLDERFAETRLMQSLDVYRLEEIGEGQFDEWWEGK